MSDRTETGYDQVDGLHESRAELNQARVRLGVVTAVTVYILLRWAAIETPIRIPGNYAFIILPLEAEAAIDWLIACAGFGSFALALLLHVRKYPGRFAWRRIVAMIGEYATYTFALIAGGQILMPFFALIVATALSNGMRFGSRYLLIAAVLSQASFVVMLFASPFWRANIGVLITFSITAIALPAYAYALLQQTADARDKALKATLAKSRFLAQASHDLRQPVHAIGYYLDILRDTERKSDRSDLIDRIERALGNVSGLFKSLLDISRLDSGHVEPRAEPVALEPLLLDLIQQNEQIAAWNNIELRFVPTRLNVMADPVLLATMVQNLLSNAIKYARDSRVLIGVRRSGNTLAIEVHDQGIGIEAEHMPHIFDEFYRGHVAGDHDAEGVGLGLSIVTRLARMSGFALDLKSTRGIGTAARISAIPITATTIEPRHARPDQPQPLAGFRVILIEDDRDVLAATQQLLERWGCVVQPSAGLPAHVQAADLIIADFDLGKGILGTDVVSAIRKQLGASLPAILLTGHAEARVRQQIAIDDIHVLAKPAQPATLRSVLSAFRIARRT